MSTVIYSDEDACRLLCGAIVREGLDPVLARIAGETVRFLTPLQCRRVLDQLSGYAVCLGDPWYPVYEELRRALR